MFEPGEAAIPYNSAIISTAVTLLLSFSSARATAQPHKQRYVVSGHDKFPPAPVEGRRVSCSVRYRW
jgi:hypothetical protein